MLMCYHTIEAALVPLWKIIDTTMKRYVNNFVAWQAGEIFEALYFNWQCRNTQNKRLLKMAMLKQPGLYISWYLTL